MEVPTAIVALFIYVFVILGIAGLGWLLIKYWVCMGDGLLFVKVRVKEKIKERVTAREKRISEEAEVGSLIREVIEDTRVVRETSLLNTKQGLNETYYKTGSYVMPSVGISTSVPMAVSGAYSGFISMPKEKIYWHDENYPERKRDTVEYLDPSIPAKTIEALKKEAEILENIEMKKYLQDRDRTSIFIKNA